MSSSESPEVDPRIQITSAAALLLARVQPETSTADMAAAVDKATAALRFAADMEMNTLTRKKIDQEIEKLKEENATLLERHRWEGRRSFMTAITPIITAVLTIATFTIAQLLQNWQINDRQVFERDVVLETDLRKAAEALASDAKASPVSIAIFQQALDSPRLREAARDYVVVVLKKTVDQDLLADLFDRTFASIGRAVDSDDQTNLHRAVDLSRDLLKKTYPIWEKWNNHNNRPNETEAVTASENLQSSYTYAASSRITSTISRFLASRPKGAATDISGTYIVRPGWQGMSLEGVNISGALIVLGNLKNANLAGVADFSGLVFQQTAWWEAKSMSRKLLDHLKNVSPYSPTTQYGPDSKLISQSEYEDALKRIDVR